MEPKVKNKYFLCPKMPFLTIPGAEYTGGPVPEPADPLMEAARRLSEEHKQQISASFLARRLQIGYNRALQLMEQLEKGKAGKTEKETGEK